MNEYFVPGAVPAPNSPGASATIRAEFSSVAVAFDKLPVLAGSAGEFITVNSTGTAMIASGYSFSDFVTLAGVQTLSNKTLAWADNTWPGFASGATKVAGTGTDNVLLLAENAKLPALDGSQLTNLTPASLGIMPVLNGGTGASDVAGAQVNLGINLKADANNAVLTGAPTCPTPPVGNSSARLANTQFVTDTVIAIGAAAPSNATPLINGVAASGVSPLVSRDDHVHPVDTSRAPAAAATATGTSFTPVGGIAATNVQAALSELDTEKAPLASPALTGAPTSSTPLTSDNSTRIATTAFTQSLLAQQPPGAEVSDNNPLMNGVVAPGTGVEASRYDHVHPVDTSRASAGANSDITSLSGLTTGLSVPQGGTGRTTGVTAYGLLAAGTTSAGAQQTLAAGLTTQILVGGGASALPVWTAATGSGAPVRATSPTLVTPNIGVATGTSFNSITGLSATTPAMDGTAAVGTGVTVARADHVHPSDTTRTPLNGTGATGTWPISISGNAVTISDGAVSTAAKIADNVVTPAKLTQPFTAGTSLAVSGTSIDFTGIPNWAKRVTVICSGVSTNGTSGKTFRLGSGSVQASGYVCSFGYATTAASASTSTTGFDTILPTAAEILSGHLVLSKISGNIWVCSGDFTIQLGNAPGKSYTGGYVTLSGAMDRIRVTTNNGTDTFDAGSINIMWE